MSPDCPWAAKSCCSLGHLEQLPRGGDPAAAPGSWAGARRSRQSWVPPLQSGGDGLRNKEQELHQRGPAGFAHPDRAVLTPN